ncbi:MAG: hypothetical protein AAFV45_01990 [Pseudomonadota bacterium]
MINLFGQDDLVTRLDLDEMRNDLEILIWRQTAFVGGLVIGIHVLFKVFAWSR